MKHRFQFLTLQISMSKEVYCEINCSTDLVILCYWFVYTFSIELIRNGTCNAVSRRQGVISRSIPLALTSIYRKLVAHRYRSNRSSECQCAANGYGNAVQECRGALNPRPVDIEVATDRHGEALGSKPILAPRKYSQCSNQCVHHGDDMNVQTFNPNVLE